MKPHPALLAEHPLRGGLSPLWGDLGGDTFEFFLLKGLCLITNYIMQKFTNTIFQAGRSQREG